MVNDKIASCQEGGMEVYRKYEGSDTSTGVCLFSMCCRTLHGRGLLASLNAFFVCNIKHAMYIWWFQPKGIYFMITKSTLGSKLKSGE